MSDAEIRSHLDLHLPLWHRIIRRLFHRDDTDSVGDSAIWNINAVKEFQNIEDVDLHVIFIHEKMRKHMEQFKEGRISFYAVSEGDTFLVQYVKSHLAGTHRINESSRRIASLINKIHPDVIHVMGAENPPYSLSVLAIPKTIPVIVQLQTLLHAPEAEGCYLPQRECELRVLQRADYIGTRIDRYKDVIINVINRNAKFVNTRLMIAEKTKHVEAVKSYDFVYFASYINKSVDLAIEAFSLAYKKHPEITLDIIGGSSENEMDNLRKRLQELGCCDAVTFEGRLKTHDDVIAQINKSRFALLPLKTDFISGTVREAMYYGLPVLTTITSGTPLLNKRRESVLLSQIGNHKELANNICKIIEDTALANTLRENAFVTVGEMYESNEKMAAEWVKAYRFCTNDFRQVL